jgi:hypothetical protein
VTHNRATQSKSWAEDRSPTADPFIENEEKTIMKLCLVFIGMSLLMSGCVAANKPLVWQNYLGEECHGERGPNGVKWIVCHNEHNACNEVCRETVWSENEHVECSTVCP